MIFCGGIRELIGGGTQIIFRDERRCRGSDNACVCFRCRQWSETATTTKEKFPIGVMAGGAIGLGYKSPLIRCSHNVDSTEYQGMVTGCG
jgi:hypothetical protein